MSDLHEATSAVISFLDEEADNRSAAGSDMSDYAREPRDLAERLGGALEAAEAMVTALLAERGRLEAFVRGDLAADLQERAARVAEERPWKSRATLAEANLAKAVEALEPLRKLATEVLTPGSPDYQGWLAEAKDWTVIFAFGGHSITLGDLRRAVQAQGEAQG